MPFLAAAAFAAMIAWGIKTVWEGRTADFRNPDNGYRQMVDAPRPGRRPATPRETRSHRTDGKYRAGWMLYQLRHGAPLARHDLREGWDDAKRAHQEWVTNDAKGKPRIRDAWKAGWRRATKAPEAPQPEPKAVDPPKPSTDDNTPPVNAPADAETNGGHGHPATVPGVPFNPATPAMNGGPTMSTPEAALPSTPGEAPNIGTYRAVNEEAKKDAIRRKEAALAMAHQAQQMISHYESVQAAQHAAGVGPQATAGMADLIEAEQGNLAAAHDMAAQADRIEVAAQANLDGLDRGGHTGMEEAAAGGDKKADNTSWYEPV